MKKKIGFCGINCAECPAFIAHETNDRTLQEKTAVEWSERYNAELKPKHINCVGCTEISGPQIGHCSECNIRLCGQKHKVDNCGSCSDYPCSTINDFYDKIPEDVAEVVKNNLK